MVRVRVSMCHRWSVTLPKTGAESVDAPTDDL